MACSALFVQRLLLIVGLFCSALAVAQPDTLWSRTITGEGDYYAESITQWADQSYFVSGSTNDSESGNLEFYLARLNGAGQLLWVRTYPLGGISGLSNMALLDDGLLLCGYTVTLNPQLMVMSLVRVDLNGDTLWTGTYGDAFAQASASACGILQDGGYWAVGWEQTDSVRVGLITVWAADGSFNQAMRYPIANASAEFSAASYVTDLRFVLGGQTRSVPGGDSDALILVTDNAGRVQNTEIYTLEGEELVTAVARVSANNYVFGGLTTTGESNGDFMALYYEYSGNPFLRWRRFYGAPGEEEHGHIVTATGDGGFLFGGHAHIDEGGLSEQFALYKLDADGDVEWEWTGGTTAVEQINGLTMTDDGGFAFSGTVIPDGAHSFVRIERFLPPSAAGESAASPRSFALHPAYPNPFNPETRISYELRSESRVRLAIYDVRGALVRTLLDEPQSSGAHTVRFDGTQLPSGIYFARLAANGQTSTQKLMLLK